MAYEDLMVTKIGYQQLDNTLACSKLQDSGESKSNKKLRSVHFGVVVVESINCKCGGIVRNQIWLE